MKAFFEGRLKLKGLEGVKGERFWASWVLQYILEGESSISFRFISLRESDNMMMMMMMMMMKSAEI